jgi:hypothetical protein
MLSEPGLERLAAAARGIARTAGAANAPVASTAAELRPITDSDEHPFHGGVARTARVPYRCSSQDGSESPGARRRQCGALGAAPAPPEQ